MLFVDTETRPERVDGMFTRQTFHLGVACYWRHRRDGDPDTHEWLEFTDIGAFWDWALRKALANTILYLVTHNLAFDLMVLQCFPQVPRRGWRFLFQVEQGGCRLFKFGLPTKKLTAWLADGNNIAKFTGKRWSKTLLAMDDTNLFKGKLAEWGKDLGFPKLQMPDYSAPDSEWWPYCHTDVEIMLRLWAQWFLFLDEHKLGAFKPTLASQAFSAFRHGYMHHSIQIHTVQKAVDLEREGYFGGRTEAFWVGSRADGPFYYVDVNSMYPYVMLTKQYPIRLVGMGESTSISRLSTLLKTRGVIARVSLDVTQPVYPIKSEGKNIYPAGEFTTVLTTPELAYALQRGWITQIDRYATYRIAPIFDSYVTYFYALKQEYGAAGDNLRRNLVKLLLNALYGKFGQRGYQDKIIGTADPEKVEVIHGYNRTKKCGFTIYTAGGIVLEQTRIGEGFNSLVAIAAHVTAYARLYLWSLIERAGHRHVLYCDTDSLIVDQVGYKALTDLIEPDRLGYLKADGPERILEIYAPKDYVYGGRRVRKGIPVDAQDLGDNTFDVETWPGLLTQLAGGKRDTYYNRNVVKHLSYDVDWGTLQGDGWIEPYHFGVTPLNF
jgi:hypothetical protein